MSRSRLLWFGLSAALVLAARGASAQAVGAAFGQRGQVAISAERLLGVYVIDGEADQDGTATGPGGATINASRHTEGDATTVVLLGNDDAAGPAAIPRIGVDFFVIDRLSIGGSLFYWTDSSELETTGTNVLPGGPTITIPRNRVESDRHTLGFSPRVGYAYMFSPTFGIWPRGGITYATEKTEVTETNFDPDDGSVNNSTKTETTISQLSLTLEGLLVISPFEHIAFGVGPFVDFGLTGDIETDINTTTGGGPAVSHVEGDYGTTTFGITSSLIAWF